MPSSNILLFDANKANMMSDEQYNTNIQRLNGVQSGIASSQLQNKTLYQVSLVAYAIAQIMNQNGFDANDTAAVSAFVANLSGTMLQKVVDLASTQEAQAGVATGKWMSPALVKTAIDTLAAKAQNILSSETKTALGLPNTAVPDDAFNTLADTVFHGTIPKYTLLNSVVTDGSSQPVISLSGIDVSKRHYITVESQAIFRGYLVGLTEGNDRRELVRFSVQQTPYTYYSGNNAMIIFNQLYSHIVELACSTDKSGDIPRRIRLFHYIVGQNNEIFEAYYCAPFNPGNGVPQLTFQMLPAGVTVKFWRKDTL